MFWKFATTSNIDTLLEKEDITLRDLMDDDDVLQECKGQNTKLVEFLCRANVMEELVTLIITDPTNETDDAMKYKYPNIACELLTSDVPQMNDMLGDTDSLREKLFSFLDNESTLNPLLASFFSKVVGILLSRKPNPTLEYIKTRNDFLGSVLKHLGTSAIMDLLLRLVTCVEAAELRAQVLSWLNENKLVERLIALIDPSADDDFHCNSAQSLCDIIRLSREHMYTMQESAQEDPLLNTLERKETVQLLLQHMFDKEINESVIINGISVLLALLEIRRPAPFGFPEMAPELTQLDVERLASGVSKTLHGLSDRLADFHRLLENPPQRDAMQCTFGKLDPPLGNTRLHVGKLLSAILITNTHNINVQLSELQMFNALLDLFFRYEYNNFLHTQVVQCIQTVLGNTVTVITTSNRAPTYSNENESNSVNAEEQRKSEEEESENPRKIAPLLTHLFEDCRLIQRILDAWEDNRVQETEACGHRKGNMGHLTIITNQIIENMDKGTNADMIRQFIEGMAEEDQGRWQKFVAETLAEMNEKNSRELGGHNPMHFSSDDDGETDYRDIPFTSNSAQQAFTDYQLQQITSNFIDQFGFTDGDFTDQDDADSKFNRIDTIDFDLKADANTPNQELFEDVCRARLRNYHDSSDEDDEDKDKFDSGEEGEEEWELQNANAVSSFKYGTSVSVRPRTNSGGSTGSSSSEDDDSAKTTQIKIPDASEDMDTHPPTAWRASFDNDDSTSSESDSNTPNTSPRIEVNSPSASFETASWNKSQGEENNSSQMQENNWANFDNIDKLPCDSGVEQSEANKANSQLPDRARLYALTDSTVDAEDVETCTEKPHSRSENMEVVMDASSPSPAGSEVVTSREADIMMDTQESSSKELSDPPAQKPDDTPQQSSNESGSTSDDLFDNKSPLDTVAMETDECAPSESSGQTPNVVEEEKESTTTPSLPCDAASIGSEDLATSSEDPTNSNQRIDATSGTGEGTKETDNIVAYVSPTPSSEPPPEAPVSEDPPTDLAFTEQDANGDSVAVATKSDNDLQNNDVTSSTAESQLKVNEPV